MEPAMYMPKVISNRPAAEIIPPPQPDPTDPVNIAIAVLDARAAAARDEALKLYRKLALHLADGGAIEEKTIGRFAECLRILNRTTEQFRGDVDAIRKHRQMTAHVADYRAKAAELEAENIGAAERIAAHQRAIHDERARGHRIQGLMTSVGSTSNAIGELEGKHPLVLPPAC